MVLTYDLTRGDRVSFALNGAPRSLGFWVGPVLAGISCALFTLTGAIDNLTDLGSVLPAFGRVALFGLAGFGAMLALQVLVMLLGVLRAERSVRVTLTIDDVGLAYSLEHSSSRVDWAGVREVRRLGSVLAVYVGRNSAVLIPRRAFESGESWVEWCEFARAHAASARS